MINKQKSILLVMLIRISLSIQAINDRLTTSKTIFIHSYYLSNVQKATQ